MACYNPFGFLQTTGPRNSRLHIHMYLHMPCLKMWKTHHRRTYFQASALKLMSVQGGSAVTLPAPADKLAPKDVFLCLCSQAQPGILLCWGHTSKGVCPFQDFDTDFFIQPLNCKAEKKSISQSPCPCFCTAISAILICIPIFQKGNPSSAIRQLLIESKWD